MYMLASYLVSKYSGVSYIDFVQTRIFNKLQMTSTTFHESKASHSGKLTQTWTKSGRRIPFWFPDDLAEVKAGPGGIISSVDDMVSWVKMLLNGGVNIDTGVSVVPGDVLEKITGAHVMVGPTPRSEAESIRGYGMGWERVSYHGYDVSVCVPYLYTPQHMYFRFLRLSRIPAEILASAPVSRFYLNTTLVS